MTAPIGLGTDLIEVARIAGAIERHGDRFLERCFTEIERAEAERSGPERAGERYAARFAAKEAVLKALGTGWARGVAWTDVRIESDAAGAPGVGLAGRAREIAIDRGIRSWLLSMTHSSQLASATAIALG